MEFLFLFLTWGDSGLRPLAIVSRALEATVEPPSGDGHFFFGRLF